MKLRACVLDDNKAIRTLVSIILEMRGYEVESYEDPTKCPLPTRKQRQTKRDRLLFDVVISDINMPNMDGFEFLEKLKQRGLRVENIAMMSGYWVPYMRKEAEKSGYRIFQKPFDVSEMERWLDEINNRQTNRRQLSGAA